MNRRDAALHLARRYPGGLEALGLRMAKRADTLRKELTGVDGYKWGVEDEELLIALCQAAGVADPMAPITAAAVNAGAMLLPLPPDQSADRPPFAYLADAARQFSDFVASVSRAENERAVSANGLKHIERDAGELVASLQQCVVHMQAQHKAGRPLQRRWESRQ
jgi:hypothetical protein